MEVLSEIVPPLAGRQRLYKESDLKAIYGQHVQACDAVIDYGDSFVLVEATSRRLTRESAAGNSIEDLDNEIHNLIEAKGEQLQSTISLLRGDDRLTGTVPRRFYPVVVLPAGHQRHHDDRPGRAGRCPAPSAERVLEIFTDLTRHELHHDGQHVQSFEAELNPLQQQVLDLLDVPTTSYTPARPCP